MDVVGQVSEVLPLVKMVPASRLFAHHVINMLRADGGTALFDGLSRGVVGLRDAELGDDSLVKAVFM